MIDYIYEFMKLILPAVFIYFLFNPSAFGFIMLYMLILCTIACS